MRPRPANGNNRVKGERLRFESLDPYPGTWTPCPATGKIAVKVINHYSDEVMRVYPV